MYAIIWAEGHQYRVEKGETITTNRLEGKPNDSVVFDKVLMVGGAQPAIGAPFVKDAKVTGKIVKHDRLDKITILKQRRRKNFRKKQGHRQGVTVVEISSISG